MFKFLNYFIFLAIFHVSFASAEKFSNIGRKASTNEIKAWDIDVSPFLKNFPKGSGSVVSGQNLWEEKCASCHGVFAESPMVFPPLIGGTTIEDINNGRVKALSSQRLTVKTTIMKLATVSTLWDYIRRAMPYENPKSLSNDEVYSLTAYLLNLANIIPFDYNLSDKNISKIQSKMPNRNGMSTDHGLSSINGISDVLSNACMKNCTVNRNSLTVIPSKYNGLNGNLADQNRKYGFIKGVETLGTN